MGGLFVGFGVLRKKRNLVLKQHASRVNRIRAAVVRRRGNYTQKAKREEYMKGFKEGVSIMQKMDAEGMDYSHFKGIYGSPSKGRRY